jgi:hypothetical protein
VYEYFRVLSHFSIAGDAWTAFVVDIDAVDVVLITANPCFMNEIYQANDDSTAG